MKRNYHTNWNKLSEMNDKDIDLSDIPELKLSFFKNAQLKMPKPKSLISLRIDPETIELILLVINEYYGEFAILLLNPPIIVL